MSVNEEFLDEVLQDVVALGTDHSNDPPAPQSIEEARQAILQHFQQEQERAKLEAKLEELGEIQLQHGREYTVTHINGEPQLIRDRISELNSLLFDLRREELSNLKDKEEIKK